MIEPVVSVDWLAEHPDAVVADVRWYLDGRSGWEAYTAGHLPGAVFVDLNTALAAPQVDGSGRHPLPTPEAFAAGMAAVGVGDDSVVVAYDDAGGAQAARMVWLLRLLGVDAAVLDGGMAAWPGALETGAGETPAPGGFTARPWDPAGLATIDDAAMGNLVLDARAAERYEGVNEPVDPRAGHIPAAVNLPFAGNLDADGRFLPPRSWPTATVRPASWTPPRSSCTAAPESRPATTSSRWSEPASAAGASTRGRGRSTQARSVPSRPARNPAPIRR